MNTFDSVLVGYYNGGQLMYAARVRAGFVPASRQKVFAQFQVLTLEECPIRNPPELRKGRWEEGLTVADMEKCLRLKPELVAAIQFVEWTPENKLRHPKFVALRDEKEPAQVLREIDR